MTDGGKEVFLNVGCGDKPLDGFVNIDRGGRPDLRRDVVRGLPFRDESVDAVYSEHFLEHLGRADGLRFLRECRRVLKPGGVVRIAMPDLDVLVNRYRSEDWRGDGDMFKLGYEWVGNRCEMLNLAMREWGHQWVYNEEELERAASRAGLTSLGRRPRGKSDDPRLRGLETRPGSRLIMEFRKRAAPTNSAPGMVSLLIPAYRPDFFAKALKSTLEQTYSPMEIVVCDDCPDDAIESLVRSIAPDDPRVRYERNRERQGPRGNYLRCLELASGDYVKFLNDDDVITPGCVEKMVQRIARAPAVTLVTCRRRCIDADGSELKPTVPARPLFSHDVVIEGGSMARRLLSEEDNLIGEPSATLFRREDALQIQPHIMSFEGVTPVGWGDLALWLSLLSRGDLAYIAEPLCSIRSHPGQWQRQPATRAAASGGISAMRAHAARLGMYRRTRLGPAFGGWISGIRYRYPDETGWRRKYPDAAGWVSFWRATAGGARAMIRRVRGTGKAKSA